LVHHGDATLRADADPERVGQVAHEAGIPLIELRTADGAGLEELFLELTADTQRDDLDHDPIHAHQQGAAA
jgi:ABC-2 type transport system ATP-binding protein